MEFELDKNTLQRELGLINPVIERKKSALPVLKYLRVETGGQNSILITGSDGDITLMSEVEATVKKEGSALIPCNSFYNLTRQLPSGIVQVKSEANSRVRISIESIHARLAGESVDSFPQTPQFDETNAEMPADVLKTMIEATIFAITQEESRYTLSGAKLIMERTSATMVTTDGHRLALIKNKNVGSKEKVSILIPRKALGELAKLAAAHEGSVAFKVDENHAFFKMGSRSLITRLLAGQFPNYRAAVPTTNDRVVTMSGAELSESINRMSVVATDMHHKVVFNLAQDSLTLEANAGEVGDATERRKVIYAGDQLKIGFNAEYLRAFLDFVGGADLMVQLRDSSAQAVFIPNLGESWECKMVLCPVRI
jgi:DNA polymerase III subunit beta